jgi:hypothetical protein
MPIINSLYKAAAKIRVELLPFSGQSRFGLLLASPLSRSVFRQAWVEGRAS